MLVQINTDRRIEGASDITTAMEEQVRQRLSRFAERLTRVEVHLRDTDGDRNGPRGVEAKIELRPAGGPPVVTSDQATDADAALAGAVRKAADLLDRSFGKLDAVR